MKPCRETKARAHAKDYSLSLVLTVCSLLLATSTLVASAAGTAAWEPMANQTVAFARNHLEAGVQVSYFSLYEPTRRRFDGSGRFTGGFLGSIDKLSERQSFTPLPFVRIKLNDRAGLNVSYTTLEARTSTYYGHSDGSIKLRGIAFEAYYRHRLPSGLIPYVALGIAPFRANFNHNELWHNGFSPASPEAYDAWVADGRPAWPNGGYQRTISLGDPIAWTAAAGCAYAINPQWMLHLGWRHMDVDVDADFYLSWYGGNRRDQGSYTFPLSHGSFQLGAAYTF